MAVSIATIPVITGESAKEMLEALKTPTITKEFIEECKKDTKGITIKRVAVSKAYLNCLDTEATRSFKSELSEATINLDIIKEGKRKFKTLEESQKMWDKWIKEIDNE